MRHLSKTLKHKFTFGISKQHWEQNQKDRKTVQQALRIQNIEQFSWLETAVCKHLQKQEAKIFKRAVNIDRNQIQTFEDLNTEPKQLQIIWGSRESHLDHKKSHRKKFPKLHLQSSVCRFYFQLLLLYYVYAQCYMVLTRVITVPNEHIQEIVSLYFQWT